MKLAKGLTSMNIRKPTSSDLSDIKLILEDTDLFPPEMLEDMIEPFLQGNEQQDRWLVCDTETNGVIGFSYTRAEELADSVWNLLAIGFRSQHQRSGFGTKLIENVERSLSGERILIVETSSTDDFDKTRDFYRSRGYDQEAVIRDYWADGDDKIIFRKRLSS